MIAQGLQTVDRADATVLIVIAGVQVILGYCISIISADGRVMEGRRHESRHRTLKAAQIVSNDNRSFVECLVEIYLTVMLVFRLMGRSISPRV